MCWGITARFNADFVPPKPYGYSMTRRQLAIVVVAVMSLALVALPFVEFWSRPDGVTSYFVVTWKFSKIRAGEVRACVEGSLGSPVQLSRSASTVLPDHLRHYLVSENQAVLYSYRDHFDVVVIYDQRGRVVAAWDVYE